MSDLKPPSLEDMLSDSEPPPRDEDITQTTLKAIVSPRENSLLALFRYVRSKHRKLDARMQRIEKLIVFCMGVIAAVMFGLEIYRSTHH